MKAGTTTLYRDLAASPAVFMPIDKEPKGLKSDEVFSAAGRHEYAAHFREARADQVCGEASTAYSRLPDVPGVPQRARQVLGPDLKVFYLVREPVARIVSQHRHEHRAGLRDDPIDEAVRNDPRYVTYSRYAMQIEPWIETFGRDQVMIIRLESYIADRPGTVEAASRFLGIDPRPETIQAQRVYNPSDRARVVRGPFAVVQRHPFYRKLLRPFLPRSAKDKLRGTLLPKAPPPPDAPSAETVRSIVEQVRDDMERLASIMGVAPPVWDLDAVIAAAGEPGGVAG